MTKFSTNLSWKIKNKYLLIIYLILSIIKKMKKFLKWSFIIVFLLILSVTIAVGFYISSIYFKAKSIPLDEEALLTQAVNIEIFDNENIPIKEDNQINNNYTKISTLQDHTKNAFISIEDKNFYTHNGVNYKRIAKATINNLKSRKLKEGASTITQQLIKNTLLTSEKTFERKIKEITLAQKLEKEYSKDEILEKYLNVIYFGNNCYGIENASNYYFSCPAKELSISQSALLAGIIKSPAKYSPTKNRENCLKRRNLVLSEMYKDGFIETAQYNQAINSPLNLSLNLQSKNKLNSYSQSAIDEAEEILKIPARQIALKGYKIYTYQNKEKQTALENALFNQELNCDGSAIVIDNDKMAVSAYIGKSNYKILDAKRQPGSAIKPLLVYAPALNEDIIYPCTQILDEKTTISDYNPKNVGDVYHGYVSATEALSKSINIPAVKILSYTGIEKSKLYAESMGINFDENDNSYAIALGGMTYGVNIKQLANAYSTFANEGKFAEAKFINFITDKNNKLVYINKPNFQDCLREDSAYLLTDMLKECAKTGTAKKLSQFDNIASKTGTVGKKNSKQNLDAWNVSYTKAQTVAVWLGNLDNTPIDYAGGNQPTQIVKSYMETIEDNSTFNIPSCIEERAIDSTELNENHRVVLANPYMPERYTQTEIFSKFNMPNDISNKFTQVPKQTFKGKVVENRANIEFESKDYITYRFKSGEFVLKEVSGKNGTQNVSLPIKSNKQIIEIEYFYTLSPEITQIEKLTFLNTKFGEKKDKWYV